MFDHSDIRDFHARDNLYLREDSAPYYPGILNRIKTDTIGSGIGHLRNYTLEAIEYTLKFPARDCSKILAEVYADLDYLEDEDPKTPIMLNKYCRFCKYCFFSILSIYF